MDRRSFLGNVFGVAAATMIPLRANQPKYFNGKTKKQFSLAITAQFLEPIISDVDTTEIDLPITIHFIQQKDTTGIVKFVADPIIVTRTMRIFTARLFVKESGVEFCRAFESPFVCGVKDTLTVSYQVHLPFLNLTSEEAINLLKRRTHFVEI